MINYSQIKTSLEAEIQEYAKNKKPNEACGLIIQYAEEYKFIPCENIAENKANNFLIADDVMLKYSDYLVSIFHSHIETSTPSVSIQDLKTCEIWGVIGTIIFFKKNDNEYCSELTFYGTNLRTRKLIERQYCYNVYDCFKLIQDYYYFELGLQLNNIYSNYGWWDKLEHEQSLYLTQYERLGLEEFNIREELQKGDILAMRLGRCKAINHGVIYLGNNMILHHLENRLSCIESIGKYSNRIERCFRIKDAKKYKITRNTQTENSTIVIF